MKVIQGKHKGTILKGFDINGTRPTSKRISFCYDTKRYL